MVFCLLDTNWSRNPCFLKISDIAKYNFKSDCEMSSFITRSDTAAAAHRAAARPSEGSMFSATGEMHKVKVFRQNFPDVCDRKRESNDSCRLCANGKTSTPLKLLVFISALAKCFWSLCASSECTTGVFVTIGEMTLCWQGLQQARVSCCHQIRTFWKYYNFLKFLCVHESPLTPLPKKTWVKSSQLLLNCTISP